MSQSIVCDSHDEDTKHLIGIKEEPLHAPKVTDIDSIKHDTLGAVIKDEMEIKEEPLESIEESGLNTDLRNSDLLNQNSSNIEVCNK